MLTKFKIYTLLHLLMIIGVALAGVFTWQENANIAIAIVFTLTLGLLLASLFSLVHATNKKLAVFLLNIKYDDYEAHYSSKTGEPSQRELSSAFNLITGKFRSIRQAKEAQYHFLHAVVENADTGLICFDEGGKTVLMNRGIQQLLHKSYFPGLESVKKYNSSLYEALRDIEPGEKKLAKLIVNNQILQLSVGKTVLKIQNEPLQLYSLQNIHVELERQELESWQKLIRILTHEILNSIAPVVSLADMAGEMIRTSDISDPKAMEDLRQSIEAIQRRSSGLMHFTETYRQLTKLPTPVFRQTDPAELLERVLLLFSGEIREKKVRVVKQYPINPVGVLIDPGLMEQVFINLIKNALEAMADTPDPELGLSISKDPSGVVEISISDNGPGIPEEMLSQIFIPFFTTKKEGSGIGLSLSRQILHLHKGSIFGGLRHGGGSCFTVQV